jgi:hypothetical protein
VFVPAHAVRDDIKAERLGLRIGNQVRRQGKQGIFVVVSLQTGGVTDTYDQLRWV